MKEQLLNTLAELFSRLTHNQQDAQDPQNTYSENFLIDSARYSALIKAP